MSKRTSMDVSVAAELASDDFPDEYKTCIYRVVQEALCTTAPGIRTPARFGFACSRPDGSDLRYLDSGRRTGLRYGADEGSGPAGDSRTGEPAGRELPSAFRPRHAEPFSRWSCRFPAAGRGSEPVHI